MFFCSACIPANLNTISWGDENGVVPWCSGKVWNYTFIICKHQASDFLKIVTGASFCSCTLKDFIPCSIDNTILFLEFDNSVKLSVNAFAQLTFRRTRVLLIEGVVFLQLQGEIDGNLQAE